MYRFVYNSRIDCTTNGLGITFFGTYWIVATNSINGPLWILRNNSQTGHSIVFQLHDEVGNRDGIGTKFTIHYGPGGERHQLRELKASGGYISFDEPLAHFGLGEYDRVDRLEIGWSTGGTTVIPGPFDAGRFFSLQRFTQDRQ